MALYAVEQWWPDVDPGEVSRRRLLSAGDTHTGGAEIVEVIVIPGDDLVLYLVESSSVGAARALWRDDDLGIDRIQEVVRVVTSS